MLVSKGRRFFAALPFLIMAAVAGAGEPEMSLSVEAFDFGNVPQNTVIEREIRIENLGVADLLISEVYTSCPCTVLDLATDIVAPGADARLGVTFFSGNLQGETIKMIEISSNDHENPFVEIPVRAFINTPLLVTPENRNLDFGELKQGESVSRSVFFRATEQERLSLELLRLAEAFFDVTIEEGVEGDPAAARVTLNVRADALAGPFREVLRIGSNVPGMESIDLELSGKVLGDLVAEPAVAKLRFLRVGQSVNREFTVRSLEPGLDFEINGVEVDLPGFEAELLAASGSEARVRLSGLVPDIAELAAHETQGRVRGLLSIHTNLSAQPLIQVDILFILRK